MKFNRTKNAINNSIWGLISKFFYLLMPFIIRTIIIKTLGVDYLGLGSLLTSVLNVLNMTELGVGSAIVYSMYKPIADNDIDTLCALLNLYKKIYHIIGFIVLGVGLVISPFLPHLIKGSVPNDINLFILYYIYLANSCITYFMFAYRSSLLYAYQRNDIISKVSLSFHLAMYAAQIIVLFAFKNYYIYILMLPISNALINGFTALFSKRMFPEIFCKGKLSKTLTDDIKKRVAGLSMLKISYASRNAFDSIVVSAFLGLQTVAIYNNYYYIFSAVSGILSVMMNAITAGLGNSIASESVQKNENDLNIIHFIYGSITALCYCFFMTIYQPFMSLWVGNNYLFPTYIMMAFSIYFLIDKSENVISTYYDVTGLWWVGKWRGIVEALFNLLFNIILCKLIGVMGIVISTILSVLLIGFPMTAHYLFRQYFKKTMKSFIIKSYTNIFVYAIIGFICYFACNYIPFGENMGTRIGYIFIRIIVTTIVFSLLYLTCFSKTAQFQQSYKWLKDHFIRRSK